jgi:hypothetical protein
MVPLIAFFFAARSRVIVAMPLSRVTLRVSMSADDTEGMGFNPQRKRVARTSDYLFVAAAALLCVGLLLWTVLG